jgi:hypothetical protein
VGPNLIGQEPTLMGWEPTLTCGRVEGLSECAAMVGLRTRRARVVAIVVLALVLVFCALTVRLFVLPDLNAPQRSDAVAVLGGGSWNPYNEGVKLAREGEAPNAVFSLNPSQQCKTFVDELPRVDVICFRPEPSTTQGEAREIGHLAATRGWHRIIVVMPTPQATRARLRIGRCYPGQLLEVGVSPSGLGAWIRELVYEWGALAKALVLQRRC